MPPVGAFPAGKEEGQNAAHRRHTESGKGEGGDPPEALRDALGSIGSGTRPIDPDGAEQKRHARGDPERRKQDAENETKQALCLSLFHRKLLSLLFSRSFLLYHVFPPPSSGKGGA
jgi:hypothetical protein